MPGETGVASAATSAATSAAVSAATSGALYGGNRGGKSSRVSCAAVGIFAAVLVIAGIALVLALVGRPTALVGGGSDPTIAADLAIMHNALDSKFPGWQAINDSTVHHVSTVEAGLPANFNTKEVIYGHCTTGNGFYAFVLNLNAGTGLNGNADSSGYEYTPSNPPASCAPVNWTISGSRDVGSGWYYVNIDTKAATANPTR